MEKTMNELDNRIQAALEAATDLPGPIPEPTFAEEILETFRGKHSWLMITSWIKMGAVGLLAWFCVYQFFHQDTMMAMIAYSSLAIICTVSATCILLFLWVQMNHNTTVREIKRLELQIVLLLKRLQEKPE